MAINLQTLYLFRFQSYIKKEPTKVEYTCQLPVCGRYKTQVAGWNFAGCQELCRLIM
jgi:hypothetical protein